LQKLDRSIVDGPLASAVWKLAWPTMLQNVIAGLQGIIDHAMVGHYVGYTSNAAIGVSWQIFLVVIVFIASLYSGMGVLVARFAGAGEPQKVNRVVQQAFITSIGLSVILAVAGYVLAPYLLDVVRAAPEVKAAALPFLRTMFLGNVGMLVFFMIGGAFRAAGDAQTPLRLGIAATVLNAALSTVAATPSRSGVCASPAARNAPPSMKKTSMPTLPTNIVRRNGSAAAFTSGAARTTSSR